MWSEIAKYYYRKENNTNLKYILKIKESAQKKINEWEAQFSFSLSTYLIKILICAIIM
jgi:hypothetical protein